MPTKATTTKQRGKAGRPKVPPLPVTPEAKRLWEKLRQRIRSTRYRWMIDPSEIARAAGIDLADYYAVVRPARGAWILENRPRLIGQIEDALDIIVRERARGKLAQLDREFAEWDAARRERDAEREREAREQAIREARELAGGDLGVVL